MTKLCKLGFCEFADKGNAVDGQYICIRKMYNQKCIMGGTIGESWRFDKSKRK